MYGITIFAGREPYRWPQTMPESGTAWWPTQCPNHSSGLGPHCVLHRNSALLPFEAVVY